MDYDGEQIGGINFYAGGDGATLPLYFVDDISVTAGADILPSRLYGARAITYQARLRTMAVAITVAWVAPMLKRSTMIPMPRWTTAPVCTSPRLASSLATRHGQGLRRDCIRIQRFGITKALNLREWVLHVPELVVEPASGSIVRSDGVVEFDVSNTPPGLQPENMPSVMTGGEQVCVSYSGIPFEVGLYPVLVSGELTISLFGSPYVVGPYNVVGTIEVLPNPNPIAGCTYGNAANYVVYANVDDGSCVFAGCTEVDADNYQPLATVDDGTCVFGECEALCPADINDDGS